MKSLEQWVDESSLEQLPVLRRTALSIAYLAKNAEGLSANDISEVVLHDPLMTLKVIGYANGRVHGRFGAEIATLHSAVIMLGVPPFFKHFASLASIEDIRPVHDKESEGLLTCLSRAHHAAWQARDMAILRADIKSEEVYVGTMLHDMGEMVMWCIAPDAMLKILKVVRRQKVSREDAEKGILGFTLWEFQLALVAKWKLPDLLLMFMDNKNATNSRALMAIIGAALARHAAVGWHSPKLLADYEVIAGQFNFPTDEVIAIVHRNALVEGRHWEAFHVPPAAAWLPMLPGEWPEEPDDDEAPGQAGGGVCLMPHPGELQRIMDEITAHLNGTLNLHDMLSLVLQGMHQGIGLNRVVFALMTADRAAVRAKYVMGADEGSPLRNFQFDTRTPHLFSRLLTKMQSVWVNASNAPNFAALLPEPISEMIGGKDGFYAMSIFVHDKPIGMMYADRRHGHCELDEQSYQEFKRLCLRAAQGLSHLGKR
ncbi:MAG: HDOD domain-containing protein [Sulfuricella sp.]|nr:HDOD domain-containing protein [Sulfuricella sp.]